MPQLEVSKEGKKRLNSGTNIFGGEKLCAAARECCRSFRYRVLKSVGVTQMLRSNFLYTLKELMGCFLCHVQCSANACGLCWL